MKYLTEAIAFTAEPTNVQPPFAPLRRLPLVILVGLTGVGKSTVTDLLLTEFSLTLLPNRRAVTDAIIIAALQAEDGLPVEPVTDRLKRLEFTARYRARYPGGMAYALSRLVVDAQKITLPIYFDGLRGLDEVKAAAAYFPQARFIVLDAPDRVRLNRLLNRGDDFDKAEVAVTPNQALLDILQAAPDVAAVFSPADLEEISRTTADLPQTEVVKKISIIIKERRNYDSQAAQTYLTQQLPPHQVLVVDTAAHLPEEVVEQIVAWL